VRKKANVRRDELEKGTRRVKKWMPESVEQNDGKGLPSVIPVQVGAREWLGWPGLGTPNATSRVWKSFPPVRLCSELALSPSKGQALRRNDKE
jgi:hypothetical protein